MDKSLRFRRALRLTAAWGALAALCLACTVEEGERASTGTCPEGEVCSDTVLGLTFYGPPASDDASSELLPRVAVGGTLNLSFGATDTTLGPTATESSAPWFLTVTPADETRDVYALFQAESDLHLEGEAPGQAYVEVRDANTGAFYDRVAITVERIDAVEVQTLGGATLRPGARASAVFALRGESQLRLVDEAMTIESDDVEVERVSWDCVDFVVPDADEVRFVLDAGHRRWEAVAPIQR